MIKTFYKVVKNITNHPLNKGKSITTIGRFVWWNAKFRLMNKKIAYSWLEDSQIYVAKGMSGSTGCVYTGLFEFESMGFLLHFLRAEDVFVDVGANVGVYTVIASKLIGAKSISIEPIPSTFLTLKSNIVLNDILEKVELYNIGLGRKEGHLYFTNDKDTTNHVVYSSSQTNTTKVEIKELDTLLQSENPTVIKIDVEGFEAEVIEGSSNVLLNPSLKAIIIELNGQGEKYGYDEDLISERITQLGFKSINYDPFFRELNPFPRSKTGNTIFIHRDQEELIRDRLLNAKKRKILGQLI